MTDQVQDAIMQVPTRAWTPAYDGDGKVRDGAWVAELLRQGHRAAEPAAARI
jgi:hypothetical protein